MLNLNTQSFQSRKVSNNYITMVTSLCHTAHFTIIIIVNMTQKCHHGDGQDIRMLTKTIGENAKLIYSILSTKKD